MTKFSLSESGKKKWALVLTVFVVSIMILSAFAIEQVISPINNNSSYPQNNLPPIIEITYPASNSRVNKTVSVHGNAWDPLDDDIEFVEVKIEGLIGFERASGTSKWTFSWNTTTILNGTHLIKARAFDGVHYSNESSVSVFVDNLNDSLSDSDPVSVLVNGSLIFDSGEPVEDALITGRDINNTEFDETTTQSDGSFYLVLNLTLPNNVLVEVNHQLDSYPIIYNAKWGFTDKTILDIGTIMIPNPEDSQLSISGDMAENEEDTIQILNLPDSVDKVFAKSYDPDESPEAFPGEFEEELGPIELNSVVFIWLEAQDSDGKSVDEFSSPLTVRVKVPTSQWIDLHDIKPKNDKIEVPIYSFDEHRGVWEWEEEPGWLEDADGLLLPEDDEPYILDGTFPKDVYAVFETSHFSYLNVDIPHVGPWKLDKIKPQYRHNKYFWEALNLSRDMMYSKAGREAFDPLIPDKFGPNDDLGDLTDNGKGPSIETMPPYHDELSPYGKYKGDSKELNEDDIFINEKLWEYMQEDSTEEQQKSAVLMMAIVILHETAHWMDDVILHPSNEPDRSPPERHPDTGDLMEYRLFGKLLRLKRDGTLMEKYEENGRIKERPLDQFTKNKWLDPKTWKSKGALDPEGESPLNITVSMASSLSATSSVIVSVKYKNDGDFPIPVPDKLVLEHYPLHFNITHVATGQIMGFEGDQYSYRFGPSDFVTLNPGDTLAQRVDLRYDEDGDYSRYRLGLGGTYELKAVYSPFFFLPETESNTVTFTMQGAGNLTGNVTNINSGELLEDVMVSVFQDSELLYINKTDSQGRFRFNYIPPGTYMVKARGAGSKSVFQYNVEVTPEKTTWLDLRLFSGEGPRFMKVGKWDDESDGHARHVTVKGDLAFVADVFDGMKIINISDPANPWLVGHFIDGTSSQTYDIDVNGNYAYVADVKYGLKIVDISDPYNPVKVSEFKDGGNAMGVVVVDNLAYVADQSDGLEIIDVSIPLYPREVGQFFDGGSASDVFLVGSLAYIADGGAGLDIIDVSNPSNPVKVGGIPAYDSVGLDIVGDYAYIASMQGGLRVIDISRPDKPQEIAWFKEFDSDRAHDVDVIFPYAYVATRGKGLDILDISDPTSLEKLDGFYDGGEASGVMVVDNLVYVADKEDGLEILIA
jgi:hypothetical protein